MYFPFEIFLTKNRIVIFIRTEVLYVPFAAASKVKIRTATSNDMYIEDFILLMNISIMTTSV